LGRCNKHIDEAQVWKTKDKKELYQLADCLKIASIILYPFIPEAAQKISQILNFELSFAQISQPLPLSEIKKCPPLFQKI